MSRKRRKSKGHKPTGQIGRLSASANERVAEFVPVGFPQDKQEIEKFIVSRLFQQTAGLIQGFYRLSGAPAQNNENDFDFTLPTVGGLEYLDLMELKPTGGRYTEASGSFWVWDFAEVVYGDICKKVAKYGETRREAIHLLLYHTDWKFRPDPGVLQLLMLWLAHGKHCFRTVIHYSPDNNSNEVLRLFPTRPEERRSIDVKWLKTAVVMNADMSRVELGPDGEAIVPISPPPPDWRPPDPLGVA